MLDLKAAGISTQFVVANQILEEGHCMNEYFRRRFDMQQHYLKEIDRLLELPVLGLPLLEEEVGGIAMVERAASALFGGAAVQAGL
jgi:arsenite-transporting ATPase